MQAILTMPEVLSTRDYLIIGFFGFWGVLAIGIILTILYLRVRGRPIPEPQARPRRRRRV
ncbi:MAG TPA: hypothetical protein PKV98_09320 [Burkholderiaceae bacterium]|nr:hypothetical protein [Burkholderiaceae bacterium]